MPIDYKIPEKIIETLKEGPLSIDEVIRRIRSGSDISAKKDESYYEKFNNLLESSEIMIVDYIVPDRRNKIPAKNLVVNLIRMEPIQVLNLIKKVLTDQIENMENDADNTEYNVIKNLFMRKIHQMLHSNKYDWETLLELVVVRNPRIEDLLCVEGEIEEDAFLIAHFDLMNSTEIALNGLDDKLEKYCDFSIIKDKYPNARVYYLKHDSNKEEKLDLQIELFLDKEIEGEDGSNCLLRDTSEFSDIYYLKEISVDGEIDKEEYLESIGFTKPKEWSYNELECLFEDILFYVYSQESRETMLSLSMALSDNPKSFDYLKEILKTRCGIDVII